MTDRKANLPASIAARLLNQSKRTGDDYQTLMAAYGFERFLHRLGASGLREQFVLKGAMLLRLWADRPYRATRDLDLLRRGDGAFDAVGEDIRIIISTPVEPDGIVFDSDTVRIEAMRAEDEFAGTCFCPPCRTHNFRNAWRRDRTAAFAVSRADSRGPA
ncbi:MAG: nucleotidyl transferase AbiEii/AbiGii toxin family protein [Betaproteobacteria bacterium]